MPATTTLYKAAHDAIENAISEAVDDEPVVLWWDDGGYLEPLVEEAAQQAGCRFSAAKTTPLELRSEAPRCQTLWYVPQARPDDAEWFKDVESSGYVIDQHIGKLAARCFEQDRLQAGTIRTAYEEATGEDRKQVAHTLFEGLDGEGGLPSLKALQTKIVLDGHEDAIQYVLENDAEALPDIKDENTDFVEIRDLLVDEGVEAVSGVTEAQSLVDRTRRWAVAEWLVDEGLDNSLLPAEYQSEPDTGFGISRPELHSLLSKNTGKAELASSYLDPSAQFWHDVIRSHDDPWELVDCPVDASLEHRLFDDWTQSFNDGDFETCATRATKRYDRLSEIYGDVPWTGVWEQATDVATLAAELDSWEDRGDTDDVVDLYGDTETGTWQIDHAVYKLIVSGEPEEDLPEEHPATATLGDLRSSLVESQYLEYLSDLGDLVVDQIDGGSPLVGENHAHQFFAEEQEHLQSGQSVALFIIDALRFDLAHELAESIRRELTNLEVDENTWVGTLPSETDFGKAALTPGSKFSFNIELQDGELVPERNGRKITHHRRKTLLENDGWSYITQNDDEEVGWNSTRVVYYWNDIDKSGEKELTDFEKVFSDRIETISSIICDKLDKGEWDRAYILSDHGFVSLPQGFDSDDIYPPGTAEHVTRRWVAGRDLDDSDPGVLLDEDAHLGYLDDDTKISSLAEPIQRFRNQGLGDDRFTHGGVLPQEFILNFVTITQE
jgi:hypothetical protein